VNALNATHPAPLPQSRGRLLVVDDDRLVLATLVHGLAQAGFDVIDADNGDDAILLARQHRPELALLDIRMDGLSGFDVAAYLRDHLQLPFMFLSAFSDEATVAQIRALGARAYLVKPLDIAQIVPAVQSVMTAVRAEPRAGARPETRRPEAVAEASPARPVAEPAPALPAAARVDPLAQPVALATGILMHRHSLAAAAALARLHRLAERDGCSVEVAARTVVAALETLAASGDL
jgi:two-component system, response regulator PdtaR